MENKPIADFCLLIPCYNNLPGLLESLESVHYCRSFYILVVDDGSELPLRESEISGWLGEKCPVKVFRNEKNEGITGALNKGLAWIEGNLSVKYVARLDCGDLCSSERFEKQVSFLDAHPQIGLLGSWCRFIDEVSKKEYSYKAPSTHNGIVSAMNWKNVFMHATVMFRMELLKAAGYYPRQYKYVEDYAFFWMLIRLQESFVLPESLVICRVNREGISFRNKQKQLRARWKVVRDFSDNTVLQILGLLKLCLLFVLPKRLILLLKILKG
jgi:glycosyltransferase involved in cell wall biosynthesis